MIVLVNPRATRPKNRRLPLSVLALGAVLEGREEYAIVDGNVDEQPEKTVLSLIDKNPVELLGLTVMPGPQMAAAMEISRKIRALRPHVPIVWGGYFPSIYADATLNASYVDYAVRGQGENTLIELLEVVRGVRSPDSILGLSFKDRTFGMHRHNAERPMQGPDAFPWSPFHRLRVEQYLRPSFFGERTAAHHASIGCPFRCSFCGVHAAYGNRELMESPDRTVAILSHLKQTYGADSVQFYDMNFFMREDHARELAEQMLPLGMKWWCEARIDTMSRYSDATLDLLRRAGCKMIFFGAESGSDWALKEMEKGITTEQTLTVAERMQQHGIIPEFSFVIGNPRDPERDTRETLAFIRKIKTLNPASEIIMYHYTPVPQRGAMYGQIDGKINFPATLEEWATKRWMDFTLRIDPNTPWLKRKTKKLIENFETVVASRWPTVQDIAAPKWSRNLLRTLSAWRYWFRIYAFPHELRLAQRFIQLRRPKQESL
ncbi:Fe-S protein, radical SAM family [Candidatus Koribacter versatilis Ellin345]|uniref:Fe-S protein, radical SAM family n=1 Tax=Koribacter versatilis (strain Ellin345) TaxID=204669 RepID=Q1ITB8_KORVE|nr:radical SAM protein [Candidatus Koribacter versatilis]ABF39882.1 Fe-S protein, radical SAM family [Candidatus Koribacter versatilis Ellin345]